MSCDCNRHKDAWLTGIERAGLDDLVQKFRVLGPDDQPIFGVNVDASGCVTDLPVFPWEAVLEMVERDCIGDVDAV